MYIVIENESPAQSGIYPDFFGMAGKEMTTDKIICRSRRSYRGLI